MIVYLSESRDWDMCALRAVRVLGREFRLVCARPDAQALHARDQVRVDRVLILSTRPAMGERVRLVRGAQMVQDVRRRAVELARSLADAAAIP